MYVSFCFGHLEAPIELCDLSKCEGVCNIYFWDLWLQCFVLMVADQLIFFCLLHKISKHHKSCLEKL